MSGSHDRVMVRHQALEASCDNRKGQLGSAPMTKGMLRSAHETNCCYHVVDNHLMVTDNVGDDRQWRLRPHLMVVDSIGDGERWQLGPRMTIVAEENDKKK
ncbi:hypothetical protein MUK42_18951 [Musa troglodytarum]|uniref:Uncharacterized protein n=1 Tax=Musa troglodytarum TaxID=320322 RepID=A0A9E7K0A7_9LILI|nr:hypothetical protein MUK42_18951 [Musa troglodytarum]